MKRASIQVQIPRPCAAAWEAMTPTAQGRHCAACQQTVTDFTQRTDAEVLALLRQAAGGRVCGRFRAEQLNRALVHAPAAAPRWQAWVLAAATLWGLLPSAAAAQTVVESHSGGPVPAGSRTAAPPLPDAPAPEPGRAGASPAAGPVLLGAPVAAAPPRQITGRVIDQESGEGIPGATVLLQGTTNGASTYADGSFSLVVPAGAVLSISSVGYETQQVPVAAAAPLVVGLSANAKVLGGEVVITGGYAVAHWYSPRGLWYRLRALPRRLTGRW